jgi:uncharacterized membrane protein
VTAMKAIGRFSSVLLSALSTGGFFGTWAALGPSTRDFTPGTYVEVQQATIRNLRPVMGTLLPAAVAANAIMVVAGARERRSPAFALTVGGLCSQLVALALTVAIELPINAQVMTWSPDQPPQGWEAARNRWAGVHTARTASAVTGLMCLVAAELPSAARAEIRV